ncbi:MULTISPECIES: pyridoxal-dependent decarboxylase [Streptomyces]|uniref:pyridoxal-dependent decarboxylase n=1 Tax=Streptomyces TaxID=1883 RepID=UPI00358E27EE
MRCEAVLSAQLESARWSRHIADACECHQVWLHVDGAYGGAGLAAPSVRHLYTGIERADSFLVDPHK